MTTINIAYAPFATIAVTAWTTTLAAGEYASSAIVDNTSNLYVDALVGGSVETGASHTAGDTFDLYVYANYDTGTSTDLTGGIDALFAGADQEETEGTDFIVENLIHLATVVADGANNGYHFGPFSIAAAFGGTLPPKWGIVGHNNGTGALGSAGTLGYVGVEYTNA